MSNGSGPLPPYTPDELKDILFTLTETSTVDPKDYDISNETYKLLVSELNALIKRFNPNGYNGNIKKCMECFRFVLRTNGVEPKHFAHKVWVNSKHKGNLKNIFDYNRQLP